MSIALEGAVRLEGTEEEYIVEELEVGLYYAVVVDAFDGFAVNVVGPVLFQSGFLEGGEMIVTLDGV